MKVFLDTDVLIDCLRGTVPALTWLRGSATDEFFVPGIVAMELVAGCHNKAEQRRIQKFLGSFTVVWPTTSDVEQAYQLLINHRLSSGLGIPDCLIASMALSRSIRLYTFNIKHFRVIPDLDVRKPYKR